MNELIENQPCERADDLVSFLYGEIRGREGRDFEQHLRACSTCKSDLAAFGHVRESIAAWRQESLGLASSSLPAPAFAGSSTEPRRSALAAIRKFFDLSPLWLKGATALVSILFCILAALAISRVIERPKTPSAVSGKNTYTDEQFRVEVDRKVKERLAELNANKREANGDRSVTGSNKKQSTKGIDKRIGRSEVAIQDGQKLRRPLTRAERQQLAADLRLVSSREEEMEFLGDRINH